MIFSAVIMIKTTTAQAASVERSAVGDLSPTRLIRLETILVANRAETNGISLSNLVPPVLLRTRLFADSTINSATACRLEIFSTFRFLVRKMHRPVIMIMTSQLMTSVSEIRISPRIGIPVGMRKNIFAPEISKFISYAFTSSF